jgi:hypothetical protein
MPPGQAMNFVPFPTQLAAEGLEVSKHFSLDSRLPNGLIRGQIHVLCLATHLCTGYWQNRQFTTEHIGEKTLGGPLANGDCLIHHF